MWHTEDCWVELPINVNTSGYPNTTKTYLYRTFNTFEPFGYGCDELDELNADEKRAYANCEIPDTNDTDNECLLNKCRARATLQFTDIANAIDQINGLYDGVQYIEFAKRMKWCGDRTPSMDEDDPHGHGLSIADINRLMNLLLEIQTEISK
jgi:hypothetical protein